MGLNKKFSKSDAFRIVAQKHNFVNSSNCSYSSPNKATGNWWLEQKIEKFEKDLYLILFDDKNNTLHLLKISAGSFSDVQKQLHIRADKPYVTMHIPFTENKNFIENDSNLSFNKFYLETFKI